MFSSKDRRVSPPLAQKRLTILNPLFNYKFASIFVRIFGNNLNGLGILIVAKHSLPSLNSATSLQALSLYPLSFN
jgi:hypothetical protein